MRRQLWILATLAIFVLAVSACTQPRGVQETSGEPDTTGDDTDATADTTGTDTAGTDTAAAMSCSDIASRLGGSQVAMTDNPEACAIIFDEADRATALESPMLNAIVITDQGTEMPKVAGTFIAPEDDVQDVMDAIDGNGWTVTGTAMVEPQGATTGVNDTVIRWQATGDVETIVADVEGMMGAWANSATGTRATGTADTNDMTEISTSGSSTGTSY